MADYTAESKNVAFPPFYFALIILEAFVARKENYRYTYCIIEEQLSRSKSFSRPSFSFTSGRPTYLNGRFILKTFVFNFLARISFFSSSTSSSFSPYSECLWQIHNVRASTPIYFYTGVRLETRHQTSPRLRFSDEFLNTPHEFDYTAQQNKTFWIFPNAESVILIAFFALNLIVTLSLIHISEPTRPY